jgi:hypothetical protein
MVQGEGFEPPNPMGADLQSAVFDRFTNPAYFVPSFGAVTET